jgi:hypothetical protein
VTSPQDPRQQPLQDDEIALARVLRALPAGEPSPRLDAAILAAATDAVAAAPGDRPRARKPRRALPWLPTWAIGTAAAVLAVGIGIQLRPPLAPTVSPQAEKAEAYRPLPDAPPLRVELPEPELAPAPPPAPPAAQPPAPPAAQPAQVQGQTRTPLPPPPPPPPPAPVVEPPPAPAPTAMADAFPAIATEEPAAEAAESDTLDSITVTGTRMAPPPEETGDQARRRHQAAFATRARERAEAERDALERRYAAEQAARNESAARAGAAPPPAVAAPPVITEVPALPPLAEDATLAPQDWFERIRLRRERGDLADARESLAMLQRAHPGVAVPDDLLDLR